MSRRNSQPTMSKGAGEARRTGQRSPCAQEVVPGDADAAVPRGLGIVPDGTHLVTERRAVERQRSRRRARRSATKNPIWSARRQRVAPEERSDVSSLGNVRLMRGARSTRSRLERPVRCRRSTCPPRWTIQFNMIVVMDLVRANRALQDAGDAPRPRRSSIPARMAYDEVRSQPGHAPPGDCVATGTAAMRAGEVLALAADVEEPAPKRERHGEPRQHRVLPTGSASAGGSNAAIDWRSSVFQGNHTCVSVNGMPTSWLPTSKNHESPEPRTIAR